MSLGRDACRLGLKGGCSALLVFWLEPGGVLLQTVPRAAPGAGFGCDGPKSASYITQCAASTDETWTLELLIAWGFNIQNSGWNKPSVSALLLGCFAFTLFGHKDVLWALCCQSPQTLVSGVQRGSVSGVRSWAHPVLGVPGMADGQAWTRVPANITSPSSPQTEIFIIAPPLFYHILTITASEPGISWVLMTSWG